MWWKETDFAFFPQWFPDLGTASDNQVVGEVGIRRLVRGGQYQRLHSGETREILVHSLCVTQAQGELRLLSLTRAYRSALTIERPSALFLSVTNSPYHTSSPISSIFFHVWKEKERL